jgi:hypothetical protein
MNIGFVYRGVLILFDKLVGWLDGFDFKDR